MLRPLKFALVAVAFAMTPFCWSVGRDLLPVLTGEDAALAKARIALQLGAEHRRMHLGEQRALASMDLPPNCFSAPLTAVRTKFRLPNKSIDGVDEKSRSTPSVVTMNAFGIPYVYFAEMRSIENLQRNLSPVELAALNGCMAATPFAKWCDTRVKARMEFDASLVEQDLVARGLMRHAINEHGDEVLCTTVPLIEDGDAQL